MKTRKILGTAMLGAAFAAAAAGSAAASPVDSLPDVTSVGGELTNPLEGVSNVQTSDAAADGLESVVQDGIDPRGLTNALTGGSSGGLAL